MSCCGTHDPNIPPLKQWEHVTCAYLLFVEGLPTAYTTDESGDLWGSGADSWIGRYEALHDHETVGQREVKPGLIMPSELAISLDMKTGFPQSTTSTFKVLDFDESLVKLFGTDGKDFDILRQRIAPGITDLAATALGPGNTTIDIHGRHIGLEKIGDDGERMQCFCLPFQGVGFEHAVCHTSAAPEIIAPVRVSDDPLDFAGRRVTVYRAYKDPNAVAGGHYAWPMWHCLEDGGCRVWWGKLRDTGDVGADRIWELKCFGPESWLKKLLGQNTPSEWIPVTAGPDPDPKANVVSVFFSGYTRNGASNSFDGRIGHVFAANTRAEMIEELDALMSDTADGTLPGDYTGTDGGVFSDWEVVTADTPERLPEVGCDSGSGKIWIRQQKNHSLEAGLSLAQMCVVMHRSRWMQLGYDVRDPEEGGQNVDHNDYVSEFDISFRELQAGEPYFIGGNHPTGESYPIPGYYEARFHTVANGYTMKDIDAKHWDNGGHRRYYGPKYDGGAFEIAGEAGQILYLG